MGRKCWPIHNWLITQLYKPIFRTLISPGIGKWKHTMTNGYMRVGSHLNTKNMKRQCMDLMVHSQRLLELLVNQTTKFHMMLKLCQLEPMQITWLNLQPSKWKEKEVLFDEIFKGLK